MLPDLFPHIEKHNPELSKTIMFEVVDLPRNTPGTELEYKVTNNAYGLYCVFDELVCSRTLHSSQSETLHHPSSIFALLVGIILPPHLVFCLLPPPCR